MRTSIIPLTQYSLQALFNSFAKRIVVAINFSKHLLGCDERILLIKAVQTIWSQTRELLATSGAGEYFETWGVLTEQEAKYNQNTELVIDH